MNLIRKINSILKWAPTDIFYSTYTAYAYSDKGYTSYNYTELGEFMRRLPPIIEVIIKFVYYVVVYLLYYTFMKLPWEIFAGLFIPRKLLG